MRSPHSDSILLLCCVVTAMAQQPVIKVDGVVNAASFAAFSDIASGAIISIFGQNLASATIVAGTSPLPYTLGGTSVTVNGVPAPLFYVSPTQINFQVPSRLVKEGQTQPVSRFPVLVTTAVSSSQGVLVNDLNDAFGIFTQQASGCGKGAVQNVGSDGSVTLNSYVLSASPGSFVSVFGTGLGSVYFPPAEGTPATDNSLSRSTFQPGSRIGLAGFFQALPTIVFAGRAPGLIGVDQINLQIPKDAPEGCDVPLTISGVTSTSQPVTLSIRKGGGPCQNPALDRFANFHWLRTAISGPDSTSSVQETFTGTLLEAPKNLIAPPLSAPQQGCTCGAALRQPVRACSNPGLRPLSAGRLALQAVSGAPIVIEPSTSSEIVYTAVLPAGSIQLGQVQANAAGGFDVGAFQSSLSFPAPIEITSPLSPGTTISTLQPFRVTWNKGGPGSLIRLRVTSTDAAGGQRFCDCAASASDGRVELGLLDLGNGPRLPLGPSDSVEVVITMTPGEGQAQSFSAPGLAVGTHDWSYEYVFKGLSIH